MQIKPQCALGHIVAKELCVSLDTVIDAKISTVLQATYWLDDNFIISAK
jgi:hypothetical protein